jgi:WD40-like Beta Propeller Repeat
VPVVVPGPSVRRSVTAARPFALGLVAVLAAGLAGAIPAARAADPPARAFELVTPPDKNGGDILNGILSSADGDAVAYDAQAAFAGAVSDVVQTYYGAFRSATGWTTTPLTPTATVSSPSINDVYGPADFSADLRTMFLSVPGFSSLSTGDQNIGNDVYASTGPTLASWLSPGLPATQDNGGEAYYAGRSDDGAHVVLQSDKALLPGVPDRTSEVYERVGGALALVSVLPGETTAAPAGATFGGGHATSTALVPDDRRAVSADGARIFFTSCGQLYVRLNGTQTGSVGTPSAAPVTFRGASDDGHTVVFTADDALTDGAAHGGLYLYDIDADRLTLLADVDASAATPESILGVVRTSPDGARAYFVTDADLGGGATAGQPNLYVAGDVGRRFIATLRPFVDFSDTGDTDDWSHGEATNAAALSPDGRRLAFPSKGDLTGQGTGGHAELYVYDLTTAALSCASCPPGAATADVPMRENGSAYPRHFDRDGTLYFETPEALVPGDTNGKSDVYAYDGAGARLISSGTGAGAHYVDNSVDGRDVFLRTADSLTADDVDGGYADVYDARVGGGFPAPAAPCAGNACRGPEPPAPAGAPAPASATAFDVSGPAPGPKAMTYKVASISAAARAGWARTGKLVLSVHVDGEAVVKAGARAAVGKRQATVASAAGGRKSAGTLKLTLKLSAGARKALARNGRLTVRITITCSDTTRASHATVVLRPSRKAHR